MTEAEVQRLMGLACRAADPPQSFAYWRLEAAPAALESALRELLPAGHLKADDVFTLIGHAANLRMDGKTDMPAYFERLASRIARSIGDEATAARVEEISAAPSATTSPAAPEAPSLRAAAEKAETLRAAIDAAMAAPQPKE